MALAAIRANRDESAQQNGQVSKNDSGQRPLRVEVPDAEPPERGPQTIDHTHALTGQRLVLAARPLRTLLGECWHRRHPAVAGLAAQPAEKGPHHQRRVEAIGFRPPGLPRDRDARRVDDVDIDTRRRSNRASQNPSRPLVGDGDAADLASLSRLTFAPAVQPAQQGSLIRLKLLQWLALDPGDGGRNPALNRTI
jgi:hypothetical protein